MPINMCTARGQSISLLRYISSRRVASSSCASRQESVARLTAFLNLLISTPTKQCMLHHGCVSMPKDARVFPTFRYNLKLKRALPLAWHVLL